MPRKISRTVWTMPPRLTAALRWAPVAFSAFPALAMAAPTLAQEATPAAGQPCAAVIVDDAEAGAHRLLADCVTDTPLFVTHGWTFDGGGHTIYALDPPGDRLHGAVLAVDGGTGNVRDVVIDGRGLTAPCALDSGDTALTGVLFLDSTGAAQRVTVRNIDRAFPPGAAEVAGGLSQRQSCGTGIAVMGAAARATVTASTLARLGHTGVLVAEGAATVGETAISHVDDTGVLALRGAQVEVAPGNQIAYGNVGIQIEGVGTAASITETRIIQMESSGVMVIAGAHADLAENDLRTMADGGIVVTRGASATSARDVVMFAKVSMMALDGTLQITGAAIRDCTVGVMSSHGSTVEIVGSAVHDCVVGLGSYDAGSRLTASETRIAGSAIAGVSVEDGGRATLEGLRITQSRVGIAASGHSHVEATETHVQDTTEAGLAAVGGSTVELTSSGFKAPGQFGVSVADPETALSASAITISDATQSGVQAQAGAQADVRSLRVYGGATGVAAVGPGTTLLAEDLFISGSETGVQALDGAAAEITRLFNVGSGSGVLSRGAGARATVRESAINRPAADGVRAEAGGWIQVENTEIADAGGAGIVVRWGAALPEQVELVLTEAGCTPRVITIAAGAPTTVVARNEGVLPGLLSGSLLDAPLVVVQGERAQVIVTPVPGDSTLQCVLPTGDGAWEEVILRAVPADQFPAAPRPTEAMILRGNTITGGVNGIVVEDAIPVTITGNSISGVSGEPLAVSDAAAADIAGNTLGAAPPTP